MFDRFTSQSTPTLLKERFPLLTEYSCALPHRLIKVSGDDRVDFLNRVLTQNVPTQETDGIFSWAALCNPQGRVLAAFRMLAQPESVWMVVEHEQADMMLQTLDRYVLRSHVEIALDPDPLVGRAGFASPPLVSESASDLVFAGQDVPGESIHRSIFIDRTAGLTDTQETESGSHWSALDFWLGIPHILPGSSGRFIPQALNLIDLGAVSLRKGCYPGQEIIARTTYRGHAKRSLVLFETTMPATSCTPLLDASSGVETVWVLDSCTSSSGEIWVQAVIEDRALRSDTDDHAIHRLALPSGMTGDYRLVRAFKAV
ncbi:Folate-binding, YgfZ [mine drainage metagenome]|uniref:Folate-binding, YgfZ n=1 Tax=mine drainage metagenome TaxID=410659 RepID=T1BF62_9ZZZZ